MPPNPAIKRQPILQAAAGIFLRSGYAGASMDAIAEAAAVSKVTLYNQFGSKQALFAALIGGRCERLLETVVQVGAEDAEPRAGLTTIAQAYIELHYATQSLELFRLVIAEQPTFPELTELVFKSCQEPVRRRLADYLRRLDIRQSLRVPDPDAAARLFLAMLAGEPHLRCLLGLQDGLSVEEKGGLVGAAVTLFCDGCGAGGDRAGLGKSDACL
jgi:TetR/AcrR family transcriptional repressor of mexJK operon